MQLPVFLSSAQALINQYKGKIDAYYNPDDIKNSQLVQDLEDLLKDTTTICTQMLTELGYSGNLEDMEKQLTERIQQLQHETSFLNGREAWDFMIRDLARAVPYSDDAQAAYQTWLNKKYQATSSDQIKQKVTTDSFARAVINTAFGEKAHNFTIRIGSDETTVRGFGGTYGTTGNIFITDQFADLPAAIRKGMREDFLKAGLLQLSEGKVSTQNNTVQITSNYMINEKTIYNFLSLKTTPYKDQDLEDITVLIQRDPNLISKIKTTLKEKITNEYKGSYKIQFDSAVEKILNEAEPKDLFAGENAVKKITGLLGEIQALYYIYVIVPKAEVEWTGPKGSIQPHSDIVFELDNGGILHRYGIQVKNTTYSQAKQTIEFEKFKSDMYNKIMEGDIIEIDFKKLAEDNTFSDTLLMNPDLFEAGAAFLGMNYFNIPYLYSKQDKKVEQVSENQDFKSTRDTIIEYAKRAEIAMAGFVKGMMHMQTSYLEKNAADANSLYIIGGLQAITSAHIVKDIIDDIINNKLPALKIQWKRSQKGEYTIVDFLNSNYGHRTQQYILTSSYTFLSS